MLLNREAVEGFDDKCVVSPLYSPPARDRDRGDIYITETPVCEGLAIPVPPHTNRLGTRRVGLK